MLAVVNNLLPTRERWLDVAAGGQRQLTSSSATGCCRRGLHARAQGVARASGLGLYAALLRGVELNRETVLADCSTGGGHVPIALAIQWSCKWVTKRGRGEGLALTWMVCGRESQRRATQRSSLRGP